MIKTIEMYQAQCNGCGVVNTSGEYWVSEDPGRAIFDASWAGWQEIQIQVADDAQGLDLFYRYVEGVVTVERSILLCWSCIVSDDIKCGECGESIEDAEWVVLRKGVIQARCLYRHPILSKELRGEVNG